MSTKIQLRRGTATQWTTANPVLAAGEVGYETDTGNIKVGTGTAGSGAWNSLPYYQLPRVSVDPATSSNLNAANYLVQGIYRLATNNNSGVTWTGTPTDFHSATTAESTLTVTIHQYTGQTTLTQQVLTQRTTTTGSVKQWVRLWDGTTLTAWSSTSHLSDNEVTTAKIADATSTTDGVTDAKLRWSAAGSVIGRSAATAGAPADIVAGTDGHVLRRIANDTVGFGTLLPASFDSNTDVPLSSLANQAALSVVANGTNASAVPTAVATTAASGAVLRESGNTLGFGTVATAGIADSAITTAKIADNAVTAAKLADDATVDANRAVTTNHIRNGAITSGKLDTNIAVSGTLSVGSTLSVTSTTTFSNAPSYAADPASANILARKSYVDSLSRIGAQHFVVIRSSVIRNQTVTNYFTITAGELRVNSAVGTGTWYAQWITAGFGGEQADTVTTSAGFSLPGDWGALSYTVILTRTA